MVGCIRRRQEIVAEKCEHNGLDLWLRIYPVDDFDGLLAAVEVGVAPDIDIDSIDWGTTRITQQRPAMLVFDPDEAEELVFGVTIANECRIGDTLLGDYAQTQLEALNELRIPAGSVTGQRRMTHDICKLLQHGPTVQRVVTETAVAHRADDEHPCQQ